MILILTLEEIQDIVDCLDSFSEKDEAYNKLAGKISLQSLWQADGPK